MRVSRNGNPWSVSRIALALFPIRAEKLIGPDWKVIDYEVIVYCGDRK